MAVVGLSRSWLLAWLALWVVPLRAATAEPLTRLPTRLQVQQVAMGGGHSCARTGSGQVWCWGSNDSGELGMGDRIPRGQPTPVAGLGDAIDVASGDRRSCAVRRDGRVWCWGDDAQALWLAGRHAAARRSSPSVLRPEPVAGLDAVQQVAIGNDHACARHRDGTVSCWGGAQAEVRGQLPAASIPFLPRAVAALTGVRHLAAYGDLTCAQRSDGTWCWGRGLPGSGEASAHPIQVDGIALRMWPAWGRATCAIDPAATLRCRTVQGVPTPWALPAALSEVRDLAMSPRHACWLGRTGAVNCWGDNSAGALGDRTTASRSMAVAVPLADEGVAVAAAAGRTCALGRSGRLWCWGDDSLGGVGSGAVLVQASPQRVAGLPPVVAVAVDEERSCAVTHSGFLACWGRDAARPRMHAARPAPDWDVRDVRDVALGAVDCVRSANAALRCRDPQRPWQPVPWPPHDGEDDSASLSTLGRSACVTFASAKTFCGQWSPQGAWHWQPADRPSPLPVSELTAAAPQAARKIAASSHHACAVGASGELWCWGQDRAGALGSGRPQLQLQPREVVLPPLVAP